MKTFKIFKNKYNNDEIALAELSENKLILKGDLPKINGFFMGLDYANFKYEKEDVEIIDTQHEMSKLVNFTTPYDDLNLYLPKELIIDNKDTEFTVVSDFADDDYFWDKCWYDNNDQETGSEVAINDTVSIVINNNRDGYYMLLNKHNGYTSQNFNADEMSDIINNNLRKTKK